MMLASVGLSIVSGIAIGRSILLVLAPPLVAIGALMPFIGYSCGYIISSLSGLTHS